MKNFGNVLLFIILLGILVLIGWFFIDYAKKEKTGLRPRDIAMVPRQTEIIDEQYSPADDVLNIIVADRNTIRGNLFDVTGGESSGIASILRKEGRLYHYVTAILPGPEVGIFYEGWLVKKEPVLSVFSTGEMKKEGNRWTLEFSTDNEYPDYDFVVITLEKTRDENPEKHVLEGIVK